MVSRTALEALVKGFQPAEVDQALAARPDLKSYRDKRGRNWLHLCCATKVRKGLENASIKTAEVLLRHGFHASEPAFSEGPWKATPVWFAIARGENRPLAEFLLKRGADPNHSLWAASFRGDIDAIRLLVRYGARLEDVVEGATPFLEAVRWSKFGPAEELLRLGANPDFQDKQGMTALHYMLKKNSDKKHFAMLVRYHPRGDIRNKDGLTATALMARKKDRDFRRMAEELRCRA